MEQIILELFKNLFSKTDPILASCLIAILIMLYKVNKKIDGHMDPDPKRNPAPHPQCTIHSGKIDDMIEDNKAQHAEIKTMIEVSREHAREDINQLSSRIETVLKIAVKE